MKVQPRGYRNNNPGNIRKSSDQYQGEISSTDKAFKQFETMAYGYRALFVILNTYISKYSLTTIEGIISRYAPPNENDTERYINFVSEKSGIDRKEEINIRNKDVMLRLADAMAWMENGERPTHESDISAGYDLFRESRLK